MHRITHKINNSNSYDTYDNAMQCIDDSVVQNAINKLGELEDKIEKGVLIEIPRPIGTTVYILCKNQRYINIGEFRISDLSEWGKRIFATPEEALKVAPNAELCKAAKLIINGDRENGNA